MAHFIAYHNADLMDGELDLTDGFGFFSRKALNYLRKTIGNPVWAFMGKKNERQRRKEYFLCGVFYPNDVYEDEDEAVNYIEGMEGDAFNPYLNITEADWFKLLIKEQNNFSLGINEIKNPVIINALNLIYNQAKVVPTFISPEENIYKEGKVRAIEINIYERSAKGRNECISYYGTSCMACGFDFGKVYGKIGNGFIHVHHVTPVSQIKYEYVLDPIKDLVPVCPNCHAMLHMGDSENAILTIEQLRKLIADANNCSSKK